MKEEQLTNITSFIAERVSPVLPFDQQVPALRHEIPAQLKQHGLSGNHDERQAMKAAIIAEVREIAQRG